MLRQRLAFSLMMNAVCLAAIGKLYYELGKPADWMLMVFGVAAFAAGVLTYYSKGE